MIWILNHSQEGMHCMHLRGQACMHSHAPGGKGSGGLGIPRSTAATRLRSSRTSSLAVRGLGVGAGAEAWVGWEGREGRLLLLLLLLLGTGSTVLLLLLLLLRCARSKAAGHIEEGCPCPCSSTCTAAVLASFCTAVLASIRTALLASILKARIHVKESSAARLSISHTCGAQQGSAEKGLGLKVGPSVRVICEGAVHHHHHLFTPSSCHSLAAKAPWPAPGPLPPHLGEGPVQCHHAALVTHELCQHGGLSPRCRTHVQHRAARLGGQGQRRHHAWQVLEHYTASKPW